MERNRFRYERARKMQPIDQEDRKQFEIDALRKINTSRELELIELREDLSNLTRNHKKEIESIKKTATDRVIRDIVEVIDDIYAGYKTSEDRHGLSLLYTKLLRIVEKNGGVITGSEGEVFSTDYHEAVGISNTGVHTPGTITEVYQHGVILNGEVISYAKVIVEKI